MLSALVLFLLFMLFGLTMRMTQATWTGVSATLFYRLMTMHGAGMVGTMSLASTAVMWFFLRKYVHLHLWAFLTNYVLFLLGALCLLWSVFIGGFASAGVQGRVAWLRAPGEHVEQANEGAPPAAVDAVSAAGAGSAGMGEGSASPDKSDPSATDTANPAAPTTAAATAATPAAVGAGAGAGAGATEAEASPCKKGRWDDA